MNEAIASPCINICQMHAATGWCEGCQRTLDEIAGWGSMTEAQKAAVCAQLENRRATWVAMVPNFFLEGSGNKAPS